MRLSRNACNAASIACLAGGISLSEATRPTRAILAAPLMGFLIQNTLGLSASGAYQLVRAILPTVF